MIGRVSAIVALCLVFLFLLAQPSAMSISVPTDTNVTTASGTFFINVTNDSASQKDLKVTVFAPIKTEISAPLSIGANSTIPVAIKVYNNFPVKTSLSSKVEVNLGSETAIKEMTMNFTPVSNNSSGLGALFSFGIFSDEMAHFTLIDWLVFIVLVLIAAVLLVAFVAKLTKRK